MDYVTDQPYLLLSPTISQAKGSQLKEAGGINSSLMTLHACLETLRANQLAGRNIKVCTIVSNF